MAASKAYATRTPSLPTGRARQRPRRPMNPQQGAADPPVPWGAGPYSIKRHGTTLATCDSEPVQTPGCIQAHGALLVLRLGDLRILQASENCLQHLGEAAAQLLGQAVGHVVGAAREARLRAMLERDALDRGACYAFTLPARAGAAALDVCLHTSSGVAVLELEAIPPGDFPTPLFDVVANCITIRGSFVGNRCDMAEALAFATDGKVKADIELQPLSAINAVFERLAKGEVPSRVVLDFMR